MKLSILIAIAISLSSCFTTKIYPIQGSYPELPMTFHSDNSPEEVWDKLIDLFAQKGLSIKLIDKSSGLIISDNSAITSTWEVKNKGLYHPNAYIVVPRYLNSSLQMQVGITSTMPTRKSIKSPEIVRGEWNVRIKKANSGTTINVNLVNVKYIESGYKSISQTVQLSNFKSTGIFEKMIAEYIK